MQRSTGISPLLRRLIWQTLLPLLAAALFAAAALLEIMNEEQHTVARQRLVNATTIVNDFLARQVTGLQMMATSPLLNVQQLDAFRKRADVYQELFGSHVIVATAERQMLLNTRMPSDAVLPQLPHPPVPGQSALPVAMVSGKPAIGDVFTAPILKAPVSVIAVPFTPKEGPRLALVAVVEVAQLEEKLAQIQLQEGWILWLRDGKGEIFASHPRTEHSRFNSRHVEFSMPVAITDNRWQLAISVDPVTENSPLFLAGAALLTGLLASVGIALFFAGTTANVIAGSLSSLAAPDPAPTSPDGPVIAEIEEVRARIEEGTRALRASEVRYRTLFSNHHAIMLLIDPANGRIVDANPAAEKFYGWSRDELTRMRIFDINTMPEAELKDSLRQVEQGERQHFRFSHRRADSSVCEISVSSGKVEVQGKSLLFSIIHDESERDRAERELRHTEARYSELFSANPNPMWVFDLETLRFLAVNKAAVAHFGYSEEEFLAMTIADIRPAEDVPKLQEKIGQRRQDLHNSHDHAGIWRYRKKDGRIVAVDITTHLMQFEGRRALAVLALDVTERLQVEERIAGYMQRLERGMNGTAQAIAGMMDLRDPYTAGHERRVGEISAAIAAEMGLSEHIQRGLRIAGDLHDIGKIGVPAEILVKPTRLTPVEFALIQQHPERGYDILKNIDFPWPIADVAHQHHERMDGSGYPRGLKGEEIVLEARILAVADVLEAMSSHRPYRPGLGIDKALDEIEKNSGRYYDPAVVSAALRLYRERGQKMPG